jgi:hypothetical protein
MLWGAVRTEIPEGDVVVRIILKVDNIELPAGKDSLCSIIDFLPDNASSFGEVLHYLAGSPSAEVRQAVARRRPLPEETIALLLQDHDPQVVEEVISCHGGMIAEEDLLPIIDRRWSLLNTRLANSLDSSFYADLRVLAERLAADKDPGVRCAVASNSSTPRVVLKALAKDANEEVKRNALENLSHR